MEDATWWCCPKFMADGSESLLVSWWKADCGEDIAAGDMVACLSRTSRTFVACLNVLYTYFWWDI